MTASFAEAFPKKLHSLAEEAILSLELSADYNPGQFSVRVQGETVTIPYRIYPLASVQATSGLASGCRQLARCLQTRGTNGFERQAALQDVLLMNVPWSIPFVMALVGEYVVEIIDDIHAALPQINPVLIAQFIQDNPGFYRLTRARVTSYWDCYYRRRFERSAYIGFQVLDELDDLCLRFTASNVQD